jgi:hypothetical protein
MGLISSAAYLADVRRRVERDKYLKYNMEVFASEVQKRVKPIRTEFELDQEGLRVSAFYHGRGYTKIVSFDMFTDSVLDPSRLAQIESGMMFDNFTSAD